jgi:hypothetical protein
VTRRVYAIDSDGRRVLLYGPGALISEAEAALIAAPAGPLTGAPGLALLSERRDVGARPAPFRSLGDMTLKQLRAVCAEEEIDPAGARTPGEYIKTICAARGQRAAQTKDRKVTP